MAPLSNEIRPISSCTPQHIGPAIPEVNYIPKFLAGSFNTIFGGGTDFQESYPSGHQDSLSTCDHVIGQLELNTYCLQL